MQKNKLATILDITDAEWNEAIARKYGTTVTTKDTVAENVNTVSKTSNLKMTERLKIAQEKLNGTLLANPYVLFTAAVVALGVAFGVVADRVYNAEKYAKKALDKTAEKVDEARSEVESLNSELETTKSRIEELSTKENLTLVEQDELDKLKEANKELERELRLKQSILSEEEKEANKDAKKYFNTKTEGTDYVFYDYGEDIEKVDYISAVEKRIDKLQQYADGKIYLAEETIASYKDYVESAISDFMKEDDYLVEGQDDGLLDRLDSLYEKFDIYTNGSGSVVEEKIKGILSKAEFLNEAKRLEDLGKNGNLSKDALKDTNGEFADLVSYLDKAGVEAEELYQYIMAIANPDAINVDETRKQLMSSLGLGESIDSASEAQVWGEISKLGDEQTVLEAYLKVKAQFGDNPVGWTAKDWAFHIQEEINSVFESNETTSLNLGIYETIDELNTKLKPTMDSLTSAYHDIFTDDGFTLDNVGVDMLQSVQATIDELNSNKELGVSIDYSAFEEFSQVLSDTSSTSEQVQAQFDKLSTSIVYATRSANVSGENFTVLSKALTEMGLVNADEVLTNIKNAQEEIIAQGYDLSNITNEQAEAFINEGQASAVAVEYLQMYMIQKQLAEKPLNTSGDVESLESLCNALGITGELMEAIVHLKTLLSSAEHGGIGSELQDEIEDARARIAELANGEGGSFEFDFDFSPAIDSAKEAGKDAGEAYVDGLESVISAIGTIIGDRIDDLNDQMDDALEAFDLQIEGLEAQIDAIDDEIDHKNDLIDSIQDEIDAIQEANEERQRAIDLQKAEYNLERMLNQRTKLIYTEDTNGKGQFRYKTDTSEIRSARDQVDDAKTAIQIAEKEKAIKAIEREIELLEDSKDAINAQIEAIERQKEATQKYFEQMIEALENYQDKFDRLTQLKSMAEAEATLQKFGYSVEDILNMSDEAFQAFAKDYVNAIAGANSENDLFLQSLEKLSGIELTGVSDGLSNVAESATEASNAISGGGGGGSTTAPQSEGGNKGGGTSSGGGLAKGLEDVGVASDEHIEQNVIPDFEASKKAVDDVSASIGTGGENLTDKGFPSSKEGSQGGGEAGTLTGNIVGLGKTTDEVISGEEGVTSKFTELNTPLGEANTHMSEMKTTLEELASQEWVVKVKVETSGGALPTGFGNVNGNLFNDKEFTIPYGNAYVNGGVSGATVDYNALVGELGAEMLVRDNRWKLVGLNGTEFVDVRKGDILFNHKQTEQLLKHGSITGRGKAYANGTVGTLPHLRPLQEGDKMFDLIKKLSENNDLIQNGIIPPVNSIQKNAEIMARNINHVNNRNTTTQDINVNINGGINLQGVQDTDALAKAINQRLPNSLKQELFKRK